MVTLLDLADGAGEVDLAGLVAAVGEADVPLVTMTEEELYWFGPAAGNPVPDTAPDLAGLRARPADERELALATAARLLRARGELRFEDQADGRTAAIRVGPRATTMALRALARSRTVVDLIAGEDRGVAVAHLLPSDVVVLQLQVEPGVHELLATTPVRTAARLARAMDPGGVADVDTPPSRATRIEDLHPPIDELRSAPRQAVLTQVRRDGVDEAVEVFATDDAVWGLRSFEDPGGNREFVVVGLSGASLDRLVLDLVKGSG